MTANSSGDYESRVGNLEYPFIGTLLTYPGESKAISHILPPEYVYFNDTAAIYESIQYLSDSESSIDSALVINNLQERNGIPDMDWKNRIGQMMKIALPRQQITDYAREICRLGIERRQREAIANANNEIEAGGKPAAVSKILMDDLSAIRMNDGPHTTPKQVGDVLQACLEKDTSDSLISTGYSMLDAVNGGGLPRGALVIIGASPGTGKSQFATNFVTRMRCGDQPARILYVSLEMSEEEILVRVLSLCTALPLNTVKDLIIHKKFDTASPEVLQKFERGREILENLPLKILSGSFTADKLRRTAAIYSGQFDVLILDYLQRCDGEKNQKTIERVEAVSRACKDIALQHKAVVVAITSLNREGYREKDTRPEMAHIRECGNIEFDADCIWMLWREMREGALREELELHMRKQRHSFCDWLKFDFELPTGLITEISNEDLP